LNVFNIVNRGVPNGVRNSPLFGTSQTLATGQFSLPAPGNRDIFMQALSASRRPLRLTCENATCFDLGLSIFLINITNRDINIAICNSHETQR
jgi:hypothetical protein